MGSFFRQPFSKKAQYLVNGESDQKSVTSKKDAKFNSRPNPTCSINVCQSTEHLGSHLLFIDTNLLIMINPLILAIK